MMKPIRIILILLFAGFLTAVPYSNAQDKKDAAAKKNNHSIAISEEMDDVMIREAAKVKEEFQQKARSLFDRLPLGWIDVRKTPRRRVRSNLYFVIFEELAKACIEIPFPQRDVHVHSQADST